MSDQEDQGTSQQKVESPAETHTAAEIPLPTAELPPSPEIAVPTVQSSSCHWGDQAGVQTVEKLWMIMFCIELSWIYAVTNFVVVVKSDFSDFGILVWTLRTMNIDDQGY